LSSKPLDPKLKGEGFVAICTIIGGPNGSGKSTIFDLLKPVGEFVNADVIARQLDEQDPRSVELEAAKTTLERLDALRLEGKDFVFETTLSGHHSIKLMKLAREAGYQVGLVFVALANVDLNVERVAERVKVGGHDIPEPVIRRRYPKAFKNLARAIPLAHGCLIYDNSRTEIELLLRMEGDLIEENNLDEAQTHHVLIAESVAKA
jgi:predicted ABC-type ATPase